MISFIVPTRNRLDALNRTLLVIDRCCAPAIPDAEIIVIDNASEIPVDSQIAIETRLRLRLVRSDSNMGAAARNIGAEEAHNDWLIMLDDDSHPLDANFINVVNEAPPGVAAIGADIFLPDGSRERGGLPEVIIGCGAAIRREAFLEVGGYDPTFEYYAEEYELCAKFLLKGWRVIHDLRFRVRHEKLKSGRDFNRIIHRLVRNNAWVAQRYAPEMEREHELSEVVSRYGAIAVKENAACGFACGMDDLLQTIHHQPRTPMPVHLWDRFTGLAHARAGLHEQRELLGKKVAIVDAGKNEWAVRRAILESGVAIVDDELDADALVIGTLSPGPLLDAFERRATSAKPVICPWRLARHALEIACAA